MRRGELTNTQLELVQPLFARYWQRKGQLRGGVDEHQGLDDKGQIENCLNQTLQDQFIVREAF